MPSRPPSRAQSFPYALRSSLGFPAAKGLIRASLAILFLAGLAPTPRLLAQVSPGCPSPGFGATATTPIGTWPQSLAVADFNGDGRLDLAATDDSAQVIAVAFGQSGGGYSAPTNYPGGSRPYGLLAFDANQDGAIDLGATDESSGTFRLYLNTGSGTFLPQAPLSTGGLSPLSLAAGDIDGDGDIDVLVTNTGSGTLALYRRQANGSYLPFLIPTPGPRPARVVLGDLNGDGRLDAVVADWGVDAIGVLLGNATNGLSPGQNFSTGIDPEDVTLADFNGDGRLDCASANNFTSDVTVHFGNGLGALSPPVSYPTGGLPVRVAAGDLNGDAAIDLVVANQSGYDATVLLNDGSGGFANRQNYGLAERPTDLQLGDGNGDGSLDLFVSVFFSGVIASLDNDGQGRFGSRRHFAVGSGPRDFAIADLNGDSAADIMSLQSFPSGVIPFVSNGTGGFTRRPLIPTGQAPTAMLYGPLVGGGIGLTVALPTGLQSLVDQGNGSFGPPSFSAFGTGLNAMVQADFDRDGLMDFVISDLGDPMAIPVIPAVFHIRRGNGTAASFGGAREPESLQSADLNGDGFQDLAWVDFGLGFVGMRFGNGNGGFGARQTVLNGSTPRALRIADLNRDGQQDLVVATFGSPIGVSVLLGTGGGTFAAPLVIPMPELPLDLAVGDFNLDGRPDIAVGTNGINQRSLFVLQQDLSFGFALTEVPIGSRQPRLAAFDADRDGDLDLLVATQLFAGIDQNLFAIVENRCEALGLALEQSGPGAPLSIHDFHLVPGQTTFNLLSLDLCPGAPGSGPAATLGLCLLTPANTTFVIDQLLSPVGTIPFHAIAPGTNLQYGPFPVVGLAGLSFEMVCFQLSGTAIARTSAVARITLR